TSIDAPPDSVVKRTVVRFFLMGSGKGTGATPPSTPEIRPWRHLTRRTPASTRNRHLSGSRWNIVLVRLQVCGPCRSSSIMRILPLTRRTET
ncbi:hypothetical protein PMAYCL1PPCAC_24752, partial [Pristionchus mayeri]